MVLDAHVEVGDVVVRVQHGLQPSSGVFAEHQVGGVQARELLFVLALDGGLHGRREHAFGGVHQGGERECLQAVGQARAQAGDAALRVGRAGDRFLGAEPVLDVRRRHLAFGAEIAVEALLDELPRQCRRSRAGARVPDAERQFQVKLAVDHRAADGHWIVVPAGVFRHQRASAQDVVEGELDEGVPGEVAVRRRQGREQELQAGAAERLGGGVFVEDEIEARHVDALRLRLREVDEDLHPGVDAAHGVSVADGDGLADVAHADPVQRALGVLDFAAGDVRHAVRRTRCAGLLGSTGSGQRHDAALSLARSSHAIDSRSSGVSCRASSLSITGMPSSMA